MRPGGEARRVAKGSGSRERRSLTYFQWWEAHAYWAPARGAGGSRGIARARASGTGLHSPGAALQEERLQMRGARVLLWSTWI